MYPRYELSLCGSDISLLISEKKQILRSAYYMIATDIKDLSRDSPGYLGKIRSNVIGNEFSLFGQGENPKTRLPAEQIRTQHAAIIYDESLFNSEPEPIINVIIPEVISDTSFYTWKPIIVL